MNITQEGLELMHIYYRKYAEINRRLDLDVVKFNDFTKNHLTVAKKLFDRRYPKLAKSK